MKTQTYMREIYIHTTITRIHKYAMSRYLDHYPSLHIYLSSTHRTDTCFVDIVMVIL